MSRLPRWTANLAIFAGTYLLVMACVAFLAFLAGHDWWPLLLPFGLLLVFGGGVWRAGYWFRIPKSRLPEPEPEEERT